MPRQPRLDIPDLLQHVIVRGIERRPIFRDDEDRRNFLDRLRNLLAETGTECYAWALIPNHFHLLLRPGPVSLSRFMRRLLTGYAVSFNRRHKRSGHLFQNRYKSIICEDDVYLLELIRYIHLNPLRARLVPNLDALDDFPWCGHAELLGKQSGTEMSCDPVLQLFGTKLKTARRGYRQFVADGLAMGKRPELVGGGLRRSRVMVRGAEGCQDFDERILGSGEFIEGLRNDGFLEPATPSTVSLSVLQKLIEDYYQLPLRGLCQRGRQNRVAEAREVFCFCGVHLLQNSGTEVGRHLGIGPSSVTRSARKGGQTVARDKSLKEWVSRTLKQ